jgi:hypothetical protein
MGFKYIFSPLGITQPQKNNSIKMAKNAWMEHLKQFRAAHPGMKNTLVFKEARKTYKKQSGGVALGGDLQPESFTANSKFPSTGTDLQLTATQYSTGGSKRRGSKHGTKRHGTKRHGTKRHGTKRRH